MCILMGKRLVVFSFTSKFFGVENAKNDFFKEKMVLRVVFIKLSFRWLQTGLSDLKHQTIEILLMVLLMVDCLRIFKNVKLFKFFRDF